MMNKIYRLTSTEWCNTPGVFQWVQATHTQDEAIKIIGAMYPMLPFKVIMYIVEGKWLIEGDVAIVEVIE